MSFSFQNIFDCAKNFSVSAIRKSFYDEINNTIYEQRFRFFHFIPALFASGIIFYFSLDNDPKIWPYVFAFLSLSVACIILKTVRVFHVDTEMLLQKLRLLCFILLFPIAGFLVSHLRTEIIDIDMLDEKVSYVKLLGTINYSEKSYNGTRIILEDVKCLSKKHKKIFKNKKIGKISLIWRGNKSKNFKQDFSPGSFLSVKAILDPIYPKKFKRAYDFRMQSYFNGISARGYIISPPIVYHNNVNLFYKLKENFRFYINKKIQSVINGKEGGVAQALITGNKSVIDKNVRKSFSDSGMAHLLAISGLHIGIIGGFFFVLFRLLFCLFPVIALRFDTKKIAAILSLLFVFLYLKISGESVPAIRAFIMHAIIVLAILCNRTAFSMRSVAIAAMGIMLFQPEVILFPSFQMSFSAVIALVAFYEKSWRYPRFLVAVSTLLATSTIASLATSLFTVYTFNRFTVAAIFSNLLAVPLTSFFIMPLAILSVFFMLFSCEEIPLLFLEFGIKYLIKLSDFWAQQKYLIFQIPTPDSQILLLIVFGFLVCTLFVSKVRHIGTGIVIVGLVMLCLHEQPLAIAVDYGKLVGIKTENCVCFNSLATLRSSSNEIAKTLGNENKKKLGSCNCKKIFKASDQFYEVLEHGKRVKFDVGKFESEEIYEREGEVTYKEYKRPNRRWS